MPEIVTDALRIASSNRSFSITEELSERLGSPGRLFIYEAKNKSEGLQEGYYFVPRDNEGFKLNRVVGTYQIFATGIVSSIRKRLASNKKTALSVTLRTLTKERWRAPAGTTIAYLSVEEVERIKAVLTEAAVATQISGRATIIKQTKLLLLRRVIESFQLENQDIEYNYEEKGKKFSISITGDLPLDT